MLSENDTVKVDPEPGNQETDSLRIVVTASKLYFSGIKDALSRAFAKAAEPSTTLSNEDFQTIMNADLVVDNPKK